MDFQQGINEIAGFKNLGLLARQVVEGFITGIHKSPFHGFSAEFAEHKIYNQGESTRHIDWKLYGKTDKLFTKRYEEETNLRCHLIIDNSSSMHFPALDSFSLVHLNKIAFSALAGASMMAILKRQRDAVGLSIYSDQYEFYAPEKGSERHHQMLLGQLEQMLMTRPKRRTTETYIYLHQIAEKIKRRSLIFFFTDMFQAGLDPHKLFEALRHLKHKKNEVVLFHVVDGQRELQFNYDNTPTRFVDVETGAHINLYPDSVRAGYAEGMKTFFQDLKLKCAQFKIHYVEADINQPIDKVLTAFMVERQKFK